MTSFYQQHAGPELRDRINKALSVRDQLNMREELALAKSVLVDRVRAYSTCLSRPDNAQAALISGDMMLSAAKEVIALAEKVTKSEILQTETISFATLRMYIGQISEMIYKAFGDTPETSKLCEDIQVSILGVRGDTKITDRDIIELMTETVPRFPSNSNNNNSNKRISY